MTDRNDIMRIALEQSAAELNCSPDDLVSGVNRVFVSAGSERARKYLKQPPLCELVSYGSNITASASPELMGTVEKFINENPVEYCLEARELSVLNERLRPFSAGVWCCGEYWLPDPGRLRAPECGLEIRILTDFSGLYLPEWSNALCADRKELDVLGAGAFDGERLVGLAGCSADCETMWQIGVDVLPEYRRRGIASALTGRLALEILERGKVPFYCCAWANIRSAKNAVRSGFYPAWAEVTVKKW